MTGLRNGDTVRQADFKNIGTLSIDAQTAALIGFALKARQAVKGFEAVRRSVEKNTVMMVIVDSQLSEKTLKRLQHATWENGVLLVRSEQTKNWEELWGIRDHKILGILSGNLGVAIVRKFKSGV